MKKRSLFIIIGLLPMLAAAHPLPIQHSHDGILQGWEAVVIIAAAIIVAIVIARRAWKPFKG